MAHILSSTSKKTGKRKKKDPAAPKRALSAYMYFAATRRGPLGESNPEMKMTEIACLIGKEWQELGDASKTPFQAQANGDKTRYATQMETYVPPSVTEESPKKKKKDPNAPKRGLTAYMFFAADRRPGLQYPGRKMTEIASMIGKEWQAASDQVKAPFVDLAAADKVRYDQEKAAYSVA